MSVSATAGCGKKRQKLNRAEFHQAFAYVHVEGQNTGFLENVSNPWLQIREGNAPVRVIHPVALVWKVGFVRVEKLAKKKKKKHTSGPGLAPCVYPRRNLLANSNQHTWQGMYKLVVTKGTGWATKCINFNLTRDPKSWKDGETDKGKTVNSLHGCEVHIHLVVWQSLEDDDGLLHGEHGIHFVSHLVP